MDLAKLYQTQVGLPEWLEQIGHHNTVAFRDEDNEKRERLKVLKGIIGLPFDEPTQFPASEIAEPSVRFTEFITTRGHELCALRLIPLDPTLPKLRMRGQTVRDVVRDWYPTQNIDPTKYKADFLPHTDENDWSTIFVVNESGIFGEIIRGGHHQLTQGFYNENKPITFSFNWQEWKVDSSDADVLRHLQKITNYLKVTDTDKQNIICNEFNATFAHDYLTGYFETVTTPAFGVWFIDYNRILGQMYHDGQTGFPGVVRGKVRVVKFENISTTEFNEGEILVCDMTTPEYIGLMKKSAGVITDRGGVLSHAAIVCRELKKPCLVGAKNASSILKSGDEIELDANNGLFTIL